MHDLTASNRRLTELLGTLATSDGIGSTILDGVKVMRSSQSIPRTPVLYEPSIVVVGQGRKRGYLGDRVYTYDAHNYLVLSVPMPFECETEVATHGPLLAVSIGVDLHVLSDLLLKMEHTPPPAAGEDGPHTHGMYSTQLDAALSEATVRLLECLTQPAEARILGPQIIREITYRVLCGEQGGALRSLIAVNGRMSVIQRALERMHARYADAIDVPALARSAGMSVSAFHHHFKAVTATSPLQYFKTIRLHKARMLMALEGLTAGVAASRTGYQSPSQFSREFKRFFGATPQEETIRVRGMLGLETFAATTLE
ncbi:HTH-type transcriptional activator RhaS [Planctomyces sp. SH-PL14]|nr:HTH-type transcriptional activator RhaS [Planctomyces sp. SH-PL14]